MLRHSVHFLPNFLKHRVLSSWQKPINENIDKYTSFSLWIIREAIEIQKHLNFNREDGWKIFFVGGSLK